jgi:carbon monoxide dehydrogenase subunit G
MNFTFEGEPLVEAPLHQVWRCLLDPHVIANAGPGVQRVKVIDPYHFEVVTGLKLAAFKLEFTMKVELFDVVEQQALTMSARGKATGSSIQVLSRVRLEAAGDDRTQLYWKAETQMKGIVAKVGGARLEGLARELTQRFWDRFIAAVETG